MIVQSFVAWLVPFICGGAVTLAVTMFVKMRAIREGLQCLLRAEIIRQYEKWIDRGICPVYAKEALTRAYKAYHSLGGNDVASELYSQVMELPTERNEKNA